MSAFTAQLAAVLRLHRAALIVWTVFVAGCVGYLVWLTEVTAPALREPLAGAIGLDYLEYSSPMGWVSTFMYYGFWAVAAWSAAALVGRELESGTARLAWTQGVTPVRWLATKLAAPALVLIAGGAVFVPVYRWAWSAHREMMGDDWTFADVFAARGPLVVAYALCALAVGTLTALLVRRALPPSAIAVAVMIVLNRYVEKYREDYWPPTTGTPHGAPVMQVDSASYHPQSHYWPLHLVETGIILTATTLATAAAFLLLGPARRTVPARTPRQESPA